MSAERAAAGARPPWLTAAVALAGLLLVLFWKVVVRGEVFYERDIHLIFLGQTETFVRAVLGGSWPVWDPYPGFGQPMLGNPDAQVLYPFMWLNLLMPPAIYYVAFVISHLLFSAWGLRALARRLGLSEGAAITGAAVWMLSGPFLSLVNVWHHFASAGWIPWVLVAADRAVSTGRRRDIVLWGAAMAAQVLAGSADVSAMTALLALAFVARRVVPSQSETAPAPLARCLAVAAGAGVIGLVLSAGLWIPTLELVRRSQRWNLPLEYRTAWSVHPAALGQTILPVAAHQLPLNEHWSAALFDAREPFLASLYLGAVAAGLVASALTGPGRSGRLVFAGAAVVATLTALGKHTAFYGLLTTAVFPLRMIRYPSKAMVITAFAWAVLAAMGYDIWQSQTKLDGRRRGVALPMTAIAALALVAGLVARLAAPAVGRWLLDPGIAAADVSSALASLATPVFVVAVGCAAAAAVASAGHRRPRSSAAVLASLAVLDLLLAHTGLNRTAPRKVLTYRPATLDYIDQRDHSRAYSYDYYGVAGKRERYLKPLPLAERRQVRQEQWPYLYGAIIRGRTDLLPPVGEIWRLYGSYDGDLRGLYPPHLGRVGLLLRAVEGTPGHLRLLQIGAVSRVIARHEEGLEELTLLASLPGFGPEPIRIFRVPDPLPRAYVVSGARILQGDDAYVGLVDPGFAARQEVILAEGTASPPDAAFVGRAVIRELVADRVRIEAELSSPGYAVLVDSYDPGWRATVDGIEAKVLRANVAFRAVPVAAGRHVVELRYRPPSLLAGMAVMGIGLLLAFIGALSSRRVAVR